MCERKVILLRSEQLTLMDRYTLHSHCYRWFGVILLPLVSFSGDATVAAVYFVKTALFLRPDTPESLAKGRAIDLSIQFTLFWMPFLVLLGWWTDKPLTLLFGERCPSTPSPFDCILTRH